MNCWELLNSHPYIGGLTIIVSLAIACQVVGTVIIRCWSRLMRCLIIRKQGWPPGHLDADGDFKLTPHR